jgi:broad specificity phosphatase PhoE
LTSKKIYLVRHGQTDFNLQGIVQGSGIDSSLNERGRAQAKAFHDAYGNVKFDKIYTSALKRTVQTVQPFIDDGIGYEQLAGLNEISWGSKEGQKITAEEDAYYHWMLRQWQDGKTDLRIEGGESPDDVVRRQKTAIAHIMSRSQENIILVCMHGRAMRILLCQLLSYPLKAMDTFEHENLCLYLLDFTGSLFTVEKFNHTKHLDLIAPQPNTLRVGKQ